MFFWNSFFFHDPANVGNLISGSSAFSKTSLVAYIGKPKPKPEFIFVNASRLRNNLTTHHSQPTRLSQMRPSLKLKHQFPWVASTSALKLPAISSWCCLICFSVCTKKGFPESSVGKESACNAGDPDSIPGSGRSPWERIGYPLQYSWASLVAQLVKNLPAMWRPGFDPWVGNIPWRREWISTPVFWLGEFHGLTV